MQPARALESLNPMQEEQRPAGSPPEGSEEPAKSTLDLWALALTPGQWKALQLGGGAALGLLGGISLFYLGGTETFGSMGLLVAIGIMLLLPGALQRNLSRSIHLCRIVSVLVFTLVLLAFLARSLAK